jgi:DNA-binding response OmpR family regulator
MKPTLPVTTPLEAPGRRAGRAPGRHQANPPHRILVVEDEQDMRQLYSDVLMLTGYRVDTAEDGAVGWQALHAVRHDPDGYNLLITDNNMPKLTGVELITRLRSESMTLPVILATGAVPQNMESLRISAILEKPLTPDRLVQTVKEVLQMAGDDGEREMRTCGS